MSEKTPEQIAAELMDRYAMIDEADHACNLLNYGWRACAQQATEEMNSQRESEARERALYLKQIAELEAMVYHTPPGQLEYAPEGWTWRQQSDSEMGRYAELESECIDQSGRIAHLCRVVQLLREEVNCARVHLVRAEHPCGGTVAPYYELNTRSTQADDCNYADARAAVDDAKALTDPTYTVTVKVNGACVNCGAGPAKCVCGSYKVNP